MSELKVGRAGHLFVFTADDIARAAVLAADYHLGRVAWWKAEQKDAQEAVEKTAGVVVKTMPVSGGERIDVVVNYGDPSAYARMQEAFGKWQRHQAHAERFQVDGRLYGSQPAAREYTLTADDVAYFRLDGRTAED